MLGGIVDYAFFFFEVLEGVFAVLFFLADALTLPAFAVVFATEAVLFGLFAEAPVFLALLAVVVAEALTDFFRGALAGALESPFSFTESVLVDADE